MVLIKSKSRNWAFLAKHHTKSYISHETFPPAITFLQFFFSDLFRQFKLTDTSRLCHNAHLALTSPWLEKVWNFQTGSETRLRCFFFGTNFCVGLACTFQQILVSAVGVRIREIRHLHCWQHDFSCSAPACFNFLNLRMLKAILRYSQYLLANVKYLCSRVWETNLQLQRSSEMEENADNKIDWHTKIRFSVPTIVFQLPWN